MPATVRLRAVSKAADVGADLALELTLDGELLDRLTHGCLFYRREILRALAAVDLENLDFDGLAVAGERDGLQRLRIAVGRQRQRGDGTDEILKQLVAGDEIGL